MLCSLEYLFDWSISNPINKLKNAVIKIRNGDLRTNIDITSKDEIGELSNEFNEMATGSAKIK